MADLSSFTSIKLNSKGRKLRGFVPDRYLSGVSDCNLVGEVILKQDKLQDGRKHCSYAVRLRPKMNLEMPDARGRNTVEMNVVKQKDPKVDVNRGLAGEDYYNCKINRRNECNFEKEGDRKSSKKINKEFPESHSDDTSPSAHDTSVGVSSCQQLYSMPLRGGAACDVSSSICATSVGTYKSNNDSNGSMTSKMTADLSRSIYSKRSQTHVSNGRIIVEVVILDLAENGLKSVEFRDRVTASTPLYRVICLFSAEHNVLHRFSTYRALFVGAHQRGVPLGEGCKYKAVTENMLRKPLSAFDRNTGMVCGLTLM